MAKAFRVRIRSVGGFESWLPLALVLVLVALPWVSAEDFVACTIADVLDQKLECVVLNSDGTFIHSILQVLSISPDLSGGTLMRLSSSA